jgi:hypothetical protein
MAHALPALKHVPSPNYSLRNGAAVRLFVVHDCEGSYAGSVGWFAQKASQVSAHLVLRRDGLEATQCVPMDRKAWHACAANPYSDSIELEGFEKDGFSDAELDAAAAIVAWGLHRRGLPCRWAEHGEGEGFCSHYDLGPAGGDHFDITTDRNVWLAFAARVEMAYAAFVAGPLPDWALDGLPPLTAISAPPAAPAGWSPSGTIRKLPDDLPGDPPPGSILWVQERLVALKIPFALAPGFLCDGRNGPITKAAVAAFQKRAGFAVADVDGLIGPKTTAALDAA